MDRRLAAVAGAILAGAGMLGIAGRRRGAADPRTEDMAVTAAHVPDETTIEDDAPAQVGTSATVPDHDGPVPPVGAETAARAPLGVGFPIAGTWSGGSIDLGTMMGRGTVVSDLTVSPFYRGTPKPDPTRPIADALIEVLKGYPIDPGRMVDLSRSLREMGAAIDDGRLAEATTMVDFDWLVGPGMLMSVVVSVLATREYARINFADMQGNLRAPELDVYIRGTETRVVPDATVKAMDVEERRSETAVTRAKLRAMSNGIAVHPGDAAQVLQRCRIVGSPFTR